MRLDDENAIDNMIIARPRIFSRESTILYVTIVTLRLHFAFQRLNRNAINAIGERRWRITLGTGRSSDDLRLSTQIYGGTETTVI